MATRYWVGGTGNWITGGTANWSTTSGGAGGASVPTSADDVVFDANSDGGNPSFTVSVATSGSSCRNWTNTGVDVPMTFTFGSGLTTLNVYGSVTMHATRTTLGASLNWVFTGTGGTITTNGVSFAGGRVNFDSSTGSWTLGSAMSTTGEFNLVSGSLNTAGFAISSTIVTCSGSAVRSLTLGATAWAITGSAGWSFTSTGLTFNAGTSTLTFSSSGVTFSHANLAYYNVSFTGVYGTYDFTAGAFSANNLTFGAFTSIGSVVLGGDISLSGTLSCAPATSNDRRRFIRSNTIGATRTITCASNVTSFGMVDLRDISISAPTTVTGTSLGDCGGNSGVTFTAPKTVYWNLVAGGTWTSTPWALTSGGAVSLANFPLPQDTLIFNNTGLNAGSTVSLNTYVNLPNFDASALTNACTLTNNITTVGLANFCGSLSVGNFTMGGTASTIYTFTSRNPSLSSVNTNSKTFTSQVYVSAPSGGIKITGTNATWTNTNGLIHTAGTIDLSAGFDISAVKYTSTYVSGVARGFVFGGSLNLSTSGTAVFNVADGTGFVVSGTSGYVKLTFSGATATTVVANSPSGPTSAFPFWFSAGTYNLTFLNTANEVANRVSFAGFSGKWNNTFPAGGVALFGSIEFSSAMTFTTGYVYSLSVGAGDSGSYTITTNGKTIPFAMQVVGAGGTLALADAYTATAGFAVSVGNFNLNGYTLTTPSFLVSSSMPKNITFNGGTISVSGDFTTASAANLTTTAGTGPGYISMTSPSAKNFSGGGLDYSAATLQQSGAGPLTISGSNTFYDIANTTQPVTVQFAAGSTNTFSNFSLSGTLGNQVTIASNTSATHTLSKLTGTVNVSYCTISYSVATGGATWNSLLTNGNIDNGNNTGWNFVAVAPSAGGKFFTVF